MKRLFSFFCVFLVFSGLSVTAHAKPGVSARAYCLMDADTGEVLSASRENARLPMASTTKIMTCLVALRLAGGETMITVPASAAGTEGSSVYLVAGETLSLTDLLYALMLESANDAASAIAAGLCGSVEVFTAKMNEEARNLGLSDTHFENPHGLHDEHHYSSALDLARLMAYAMKDPQFAEITRTRSMRISAPDGKYRLLTNHNRLLKTNDRCVGGKTGFTKAAGRCLVSAYRTGSKTLICVTLNDECLWW